MPEPGLGTASRPAHDGTTATVVDVPERERFEAYVDQEMVGYITRRLWQGQVSLINTVTEPAWRGRGIAGAMTLAALDLVATAGLGVIPRCPVVAGEILRHPEMLGLVAPRYRRLLRPSPAPAGQHSDALELAADDREFRAAETGAPHDQDPVVTAHGDGDDAPTFREK
jgi:uncharacterized protein